MNLYVKLLPAPESMKENRGRGQHSVENLHTTLASLHFIKQKAF